MLQVAQAQRIRTKKDNNSTKPVMGEFMSLKMNSKEKYTLADHVGNITPRQYTKQLVNITDN